MCAAVVLGLVLISCTSVRQREVAKTIHRNPSDLHAGLRRALHLPKVAAGGRCPTTQGMSRPTAAFSETLGEGPVRPVLIRDGRFSYKAPTGSNADPFPSSTWGGGKVLWAIGPEITSDVLIRGHQIDGAGDIRFGMAPDPDVELILPNAIAGPKPDSAGWRGIPSEVRIEHRGCYAFQIDTASTIVVVSATPA